MNDQAENRVPRIEPPEPWPRSARSEQEMCVSLERMDAAVQEAIEDLGRYESARSDQHYGTNLATAWAHLRAELARRNAAILEVASEIERTAGDGASEIRRKCVARLKAIASEGK